MFPNYNDNASQTTPNSLNESTTINLDFINQEVKLRKNSMEANNIKTIQLISEIKNTGCIHVYLNIIFIDINIVF